MPAGKCEEGEFSGSSKAAWWQERGVGSANVSLKKRSMGSTFTLGKGDELLENEFGAWDSFATTRHGGADAGL